MRTELGDARTGNTGNAKKILGRHETPRGFACRCGDGRLSAEPPKKLLDDHCSTQAEMVDASLGIMGILRIVGIMGKCWGRHEIPRGFARSQW